MANRTSPSPRGLLIGLSVVTVAFIVRSAERKLKPRAGRRFGQGRGRAGDTRAGLGKTLIHGFLSWGVLVGLVGGVILNKRAAEEAKRAPLAAISVEVAPSIVHRWQQIPTYRDRVPVLVFHGIGGHRSYLTETRSLFVKQMTLLKDAGFHTLTINQYVGYLRGVKELPTKPILLTFDDGRLDAYRAANSILEKYGFHATELVVPGWVNSHPNFSLNWGEIEAMSRSSTWDVEEHFGYGSEGVQIDKSGRTGGRFADLEYFPGKHGKGGRLETFAQFRKAFVHNMVWGEAQLKAHIPGFKPLAMAIPRSDYGETYTNDKEIPGFILPWLDAHYPVVFGGDYLEGPNNGRHGVTFRTASNQSFVVGGRTVRQSKYVDWRITMGPEMIVPVLRCRLMDWIHDTPTWKEYLCLHLARKRGSLSD